MFKSLVLTAVLLMPLAVSAKPLTMETCDVVAKEAKAAMTLRQANYPLNKVLPELKGNKLSIEILLNAYEKPVFGTEEYQVKAVNEFTSFWYRECVKVVRAQS